MDQEQQAVDKAQAKILQFREQKATAGHTPLTANTDADYFAGVLERVKNVSPDHQDDRPVEVPEKYVESFRLIYHGVSKKYEGCCFENFHGNEKLVNALREAKDRSLVLTGDTGCGKTHLAVAILGEKKKRSSFLITVPELLLKIRGTFNTQSTETEEDIINQYASYDLLVLDDLGAEKSTEYSITTLYLIIDRRNRDGNQTIITTNLTLEDIEANLGPRIASRLAEMKIIKINMPDYRKNR